MKIRRWIPTLAAAALVAGALAFPAPVTAQSENVRVTLLFIEADGFTEQDPAIAPIVEQLRRLFRFQGYRLMTEATMLVGLPTENDPSFVSQRVAPSEEDAFGIDLQMWDRPDSEAVRVGLSIHDQYLGTDVMEVQVNARIGQTIVLGSSQYRPDRPTLIVAFRIDAMP